MKMQLIKVLQDNTEKEGDFQLSILFANWD